jgi:hypothetical protein
MRAGIPLNEEMAAGTPRADASGLHSSQQNLGATAGGMEETCFAFDARTSTA